MNQLRIDVFLAYFRQNAPQGGFAQGKAIGNIRMDAGGHCLELQRLVLRPGDIPANGVGGFHSLVGIQLDAGHIRCQKECFIQYLDLHIGGCVGGFGCQFDCLNGIFFCHSADLYAGNSNAFHDVAVLQLHIRTTSQYDSY